MDFEVVYSIFVSEILVNRLSFHFVFAESEALWPILIGENVPILQYAKAPPNSSLIHKYPNN